VSRFPKKKFPKAGVDTGGTVYYIEINTVYRETEKEELL